MKALVALLISSFVSSFVSAATFSVNQLTPSMQEENTTATFDVTLSSIPPGNTTITFSAVGIGQTTVLDYDPPQPLSFTFNETNGDFVRVTVPLKAGGGPESNELFRMEFRSLGGLENTLITKNVTILGDAPIAGDANRDGVKNNSDLVQVLAANKYLTGQPAGWHQGDWNGDGLFNQLDLILYLQ